MEFKKNICPSCNGTGNKKNSKDLCPTCSGKGYVKDPILINDIYANQYQIMAARTINMELSQKQKEMHALHEMAGEVGEIHSLYQKLYQGHDFDDDHAKKEVGDLLWGIAEYCTAKGWNLSEIMNLNIAKLKERYPDGFDINKSLHRREGDI